MKPLEVRVPICNIVGTPMKTTIELSDALLAEAKREAARRKITLRALFEEALRAALASRKRAAFVLRDASVTGRGLTPALRDAPWDSLRDAIYPYPSPASA